MKDSKLVNPPSLFRLFDGTEDERKEKIMLLAKHLKNDYLMLSDEMRDYTAIYNMLAYYNFPIHLFYEFGDFAGLLGFTNIIKGHKADIIFKIWDKSIFNKTFVRQTIELLDSVMGELSLRRLNAQTADRRMVKLATMTGFNLDGEREDDFRWDGKLYKQYFMGRTLEE